jgi:hypothetical protein
VVGVAIVASGGALLVRMRAAAATD